MSRYIDADALLDIFKTLKWDASCSIVEDMPTADVVEIVRCKDCTWWKSIFSWNGKEHKVCVRDASEPPRDSNDYCSHAEVKERNWKVK